MINEGLYTWGNMKILIIFAEANIPSFSSQQYKVGYEIFHVMEGLKPGFTIYVKFKLNKR